MQRWRRRWRQRWAEGADVGLCWGAGPLAAGWGLGVLWLLLCECWMLRRCSEFLLLKWLQCCPNNL